MGEAKARSIARLFLADDVGNPPDQNPCEAENSAVMQCYNYDEAALSNLVACIRAIACPSSTDSPCFCRKVKACGAQHEECISAVDAAIDCTAAAEGVNIICS